MRYQVFLGIARGEANLGNFNNAYRALKEASDILPKTSGPIKVVQLIGVELELAKLSKSLCNKNYLEKIGNLAIMIARNHGYIRYKERVREYLNDILN